MQCLSTFRLVNVAECVIIFFSLLKKIVDKLELKNATIVKGRGPSIPVKFVHLSLVFVSLCDQGMREM